MNDSLHRERGRTAMNFLVNMIQSQLKSFIQLNTTNHSELKKSKAKKKGKRKLREKEEKKKWNSQTPM